jgi:hypothetical protein
MQCILYKIYFWKGFSYVLQIDMHLICAPMLTKFYSCKKWVLHITAQFLLYLPSNQFLFRCRDHCAWEDKLERLDLTSSSLVLMVIWGGGGGWRWAPLLILPLVLSIEAMKGWVTAPARCDAKVGNRGSYAGNSNAQILFATTWVCWFRVCSLTDGCGNIFFGPQI